MNVRTGLMIVIPGGAILLAAWMLMMARSRPPLPPEGGTTNTAETGKNALVVPALAGIGTGRRPNCDLRPGDRLREGAFQPENTSGVAPSIDRSGKRATSHVAHGSQSVRNGRSVHGDGGDEIPTGIGQRTDLPVLSLADMATACMAAIANDDPVVLAGYRESLILAGNAAIDVLTPILSNGDETAERFAFDILLRIATPQSRVAALGHMLTRPAYSDRNWPRLARMLGPVLQGDMVALIAGLIPQADAQGRPRLLGLLPYLESQEALSRLLRSAATMDDPGLEQAALAVAFGAGKRGASEIMKDLIMTHSDPDVVAYAAMGLARTGHRDAAFYLAAIGSSDDEPSAEAARWALTWIRAGYSQAALIDIAGNAGYLQEVREAALAALSASGGDYVRRALQNVVLTTGDAWGASAAGLALLRLNSTAANMAVRPDEEVWY